MADVVRPPFGVKVERFSNLGYHPRLEVRSGTYKFHKIFPGCYHTEKPRRIVSKVSRWKAEWATQEYSRRLGYRNDRLLKKRKWLKSINGPGWQEFSTPTCIKGISFPKALRYPVGKLKDYAVPGPGTYGKNHVPFTRTEEKSRGKGFSFSILPSFEQTSKAPRSLNVPKSYHLPPNLYTIKNSTEEILSKKVSKKGPYELFSAERFPAPIVPKLSVLRPGVHPSSLNHPKNAFKGVFLRCGRTCQLTSRLTLMDLALAKKNPSDPGPNHYNPYPIRPVKQSPAPFNSSVKEVRPIARCELTASPGRYNQDLNKTIIGNGMRSAFLSKVQRSPLQREKLSWFE